MSIAKITLSFLLFFFFSCSGNTGEDLEKKENKKKDIESFIVHAGNKSFEGSIDEERKKITIPGIEYTSTITIVSCHLKDGLTFAVDPQQWVGSWKNEVVLCVKTPDDEKYNYAVTFPDFS